MRSVKAACGQCEVMERETHFPLDVILQSNSIELLDDLLRTCVLLDFSLRIEADHVGSTQCRVDFELLLKSFTLSSLHLFSRQLDHKLDLLTGVQLVVSLDGNKKISTR